jgi:hypothetical protein
VFNQSVASPINENFNEMGYTTHSSILNLDTIFLVIIGSAAMLLGAIVLKVTVVQFLSETG